MRINISRLVSFSLMMALLSNAEISYAHFKTTPNSPIQISNDAKLSYKAGTNGDRVPDFSFCGYMASELAIPDVQVKVIIPALTGNATEQIQAAIDYVSALPMNQKGFRGTVLLEKGTFEVAGTLTIHRSGVVLRGSGCGDDGTILLGSGVDRETLIRIAGINNRKATTPIQLEDKYFPVNSTVLTFNKDHSFQEESGTHLLPLSKVLLLPG